eukprot:SAG31_NODE_1009_length_10404_cov_27.639981_9_plen_204_part_00
MRLKHVLLTNPRALTMTYVSSPEAIEAEQEVLDEVIKFVTERYPDRFTFDADRAIIETHTQGYKHIFHLKDFASKPLQLAVSSSGLSRYTLLPQQLLNITTCRGFLCKKISTFWWKGILLLPSLQEESRTRTQKKRIMMRRSMQRTTHRVNTTSSWLERRHSQSMCRPYTVVQCLLFTIRYARPQHLLLLCCCVVILVITSNT